MIRSTCLLLGLLALLLQGSSGGHMLLVEHSRCAEHGELVHGDAHQHGASADRHAESAALHTVPDSGSEGAHDHCTISSDRRDALVSIVDADADIQVWGTHGDFRLRSAVITPSTPRLRIAPKTSPPA